MASVFYSEDLTCSVCARFFTEPVMLPCGHSFCRSCVAAALDVQPRCPECRAAVSAEAASLPTSVALKSLAERAKQVEKTEKEQELCPEHEEKLKLFCVTDQQLACIICRDGEKHEGHKFKPIKEAAASLKKELETFLQHAADDISAVESLSNAQQEEIRKTKEKSTQLMTQISRQFQEMQQFLRRREDEIKNELKNKQADCVEKMTEALNAIEAALSESRALESKATSVLKITDPEQFLRTWTQGTSTTSKEHLFKPRAEELQVVNTSLSMGVHESHLQFFVWKEMLQVVQTRAEQLTLWSNSPNVAVSGDGRRLFWKTKPNTNQPGRRFGASTFGHQAAFGQASGFGTGFSFSVPGNAAVELNDAYSVREFSSGQHYWEIEVGGRNYWELGIQDNSLRYDGQKFSSCSPTFITELAFENEPRKIGVYLNCPDMKLSFYDADTMAHLHTKRTAPESTPASAYFSIRYSEPDLNPLTVCWY